MEAGCHSCMRIWWTVYLESIYDYGDITACLFMYTRECQTYSFAICSPNVCCGRCASCGVSSILTSSHVSPRTGKSTHWRWSIVDTLVWRQLRSFHIDVLMFTSWCQVMLTSQWRTSSPQRIWRNPTQRTCILLLNLLNGMIGIGTYFVIVADRCERALSVLNFEWPFELEWSYGHLITN